MAESFITQCPHCGTSFKVRTEQLSIANGSVRCGACLQVFGAKNHVITDTTLAHKVAPPEKKSAVEIQKNKAEPDNLQTKSSERIEPEFGEFFDDDDTEYIFSDSADDQQYKSDESEEDSLFDEDDLDEGLGELSDTFLNLNDHASHKKKSASSYRDESSVDMEPEEADESWAEAILAELEEENSTQSSEPKKTERDVSSSTEPSPPLESVPDILAAELNEPDVQSASQIVNQASQNLGVEFHLDEQLNKFRPLTWSVIILLLMVLAGQLAWLQRDTYSRLDQWRGVYEVGCNILGCELPDQIDIDSIRASILVREHKDPSLKDIRIVDIILTNTAPFKQAFPSLILQFTDINGNLVADQIFNPDTYLRGEMTGVKLMPINTRVYVSLPIANPTNDAVNYQLLLSPTPS